MTTQLARMETGAPFKVGDRVTAITKTGATTKVRGVIKAVHAPLEAEWTGGVSVDPWEFDVAWDDARPDSWKCYRCGAERDGGGETAESAYIGKFGIKRDDSMVCCGEAMSPQAQRGSRVNEHEIKLLSAVDLLGELGQAVLDEEAAAAPAEPDPFEQALDDAGRIIFGGLPEEPPDEPTRDVLL